MRVAIDKKSIKGIKDLNEYEYIYVFDDEELEELKKLKIHCIKADCIKQVDINLTDYEIECLKKAKVTDKDWWIKPEYRNYKLGVIVPNCDYAEYLENCLGSILKQTYENYEVIFVDDCSSDNSVKIAKRLIGDKGKVIELKQKRYNGGARNEAYLHLSEDVDYVLYMDSDDWYDREDVFEKINRKLQGSPDVLFIGIASYKNGIQMDCFKPDYKDKYEALKSWSGSCGKVIKKELAIRQDCLYAEGTLKEDRNQHCRICIKMRDFKCLSDCVYVWNRENRKSVTSIRNEKWKTSTIRHYADTLQLQMEEKGKDDKVDSYLNERVSKTKREMESGGDAQW